MTSNLIAFWRSENERWANEQKALHDKVTEQQNAKRMELEDAWNRMNLQIAQFRANEEARHNAAQERLTALGQQLQQQEIALAIRRQEETERYNREQIAQAERNRVTNSYLTQKQQHIDERYNAKRIEIDQQKNDLTRRGQNINLGLGILNYSSTRRGQNITKRGQTLNFISDQLRNGNKNSFGIAIGNWVMHGLSTALGNGGNY